MKWTTAFFAIFGAAAASAQVPEGITAAKLLAECKAAVRTMDSEGTYTAQDLIDSTSCLSYFQGIQDALSINVEGGSGPVLCLPQGVHSGQLARVFVRWAEMNPERLHQHKSVGAIMSSTSAFGCRRAPKV